MAHFIPSQREFPFFALLLAALKKNENLYKAEKRRNFLHTWDLHCIIKAKLQNPDVKLDELKSVVLQNIDDINEKEKHQFCKDSITKALEEAHKEKILVPDLK